MNQLDIEAYARSLNARADEASVLKRVEIDVADWKAQQNMCHHNASMLHLIDNRYIPVRGWLYFDLPGLDYVKFVSHSAVKTPEGDIVDITPKAAWVTQDYPFLESDLSDDAYEHLLEALGCGEINLRVKNV